jgi:hypothetical protein
MSAWNPKNPLKYIKMRLDNSDTREMYLSKPMLELQEAIVKGDVPLFSQFSRIGEWRADEGVDALFLGPNLGIDTLHQSVYYQLANLGIMAERHYAFPRAAGHVFEHEVVLHMARAITLGCTAEAQRFIELLWRDPEVMYLHQPMTRTPAYLFNLYSLWSGTPLPPLLKELEVKEPYRDLLAVWRSTDLNDVRTAVLPACDFHIARSRNHSNRETFEFCDLDFRLQPVEIHAFLRLREMVGLENPIIDHPIMNNPAGKLYPMINVEPDPIIAPALKIALAQVEEEKRGRGLP